MGLVNEGIMIKIFKNLLVLLKLSCFYKVVVLLKLLKVVVLLKLLKVVIKVNLFKVKLLLKLLLKLSCLKLSYY